ncbi:MAG: GNAT family N-acetyltransferase [Muribaculaceae bacterium]|nr:GNAT family N-acetyltransferase [Muribaculaceae bacterium]
MEFLKDEDIRLRAVEPKDAGEMWEIESDSRQWYENGMMAPISYYHLQEYASKYDSDPYRSGQIRLIAERWDHQKDDYVTFGIFDLYEISAQRRTAFVGIYIKENWRNTGVAGRVLNLGEDYARRLLNLRILGAKINATNLASKNLFENNGFILSGTLRDWLITGNTTNDLLIYAKHLI